MTSPWIAPSVDLTVTWTRVAAACLSTFVSASDTCLKTIDETRKLERNRLKWLEQLPETGPRLAHSFHGHRPPSTGLYSRVLGLRSLCRTCTNLYWNAPLPCRNDCPPSSRFR